MDRNRNICINCRHLQTGWFHPRCGNPLSPKHMSGVRDGDSCSGFTDKASPIAQPQAVAKSTAKPKPKGKPRPAFDPSVLDPDADA